MKAAYSAGVDVAIGAVGIPTTFDIRQAIIAPSGCIANVGVHGKSVEFHLERLRALNIMLNMRLVDAGTTPMPLRMVHDAKILISHRF